MKKCIRVLALVLAMTMLLSVTALAADENGKATITDVTGSGATAAFEDGSDEKITVTFTSDAITEGGQYLILMVKGSQDEYTITEDSILYIDQVSGNSEGSISFTVYPSSIQNSVILISGAGVNGERGPLIAAIVEAEYILGDVDRSGEVDVGDATMLLRYIAGLTTADQVDLQAANVDGSQNIDVGDATLLLRVIAGLATLK